CNGASTTIQFTAVNLSDPNAPTTTGELGREVTRLYYISDTNIGTKEYLTSSSITVAGSPFTCTQSDNTARKKVEVSFVLSKSVPSINDQSDVSDTFRTVVQLRN